MPKSKFDQFAEVIAGQFERRQWDVLTVDQKYRAREAASAALDALQIGGREFQERFIKPERDN